MRQWLMCAILAVALLPPPLVGDEDVTPSSVADNATLTIDGPEKSLQPGEEAWLKISGLTLDEIKTAKKDGLFDLTVFPLNGTRVHATYDWLQDTLELAFEAQASGEYLVKLHLVRDNKLEIATIVVAVEGDKPNPQPGPGPEPQPEPGPSPVSGTRLVLVLAESEAMTWQEAATASSLNRYLVGKPNCLYRMLDPQTPTQGNWGEPYWNSLKANQVELPAMVVAVLPDNVNQLKSPHILTVAPLDGFTDVKALVDEALQ